MIWRRFKAVSFFYGEVVRLRPLSLSTSHLVRQQQALGHGGGGGHAAHSRGGGGRVGQVRPAGGRRARHGVACGVGWFEGGREWFFVWRRWRVQCGENVKRKKKPSHLASRGGARHTLPRSSASVAFSVTRWPCYPRWHPGAQRSAPGEVRGLCLFFAAAAAWAAQPAPRPRKSEEKWKPRQQQQGIIIAPGGPAPALLVRRAPQTSAGQSPCKIEATRVWGVHTFWRVRFFHATPLPAHAS